MPPDSLRAVLDSVFAAPAYDWVERADPLAFLTRWLGTLERWLFRLRDANPLGFRLLLAALIVVLVVILVHAGWLLLRTVRPGGAPVVAGPPALRRDAGWYRGEADRLAAEGRWVEAVQADFLALVLALDARQLLRFHPAKTPAEYGAEPAFTPRAREEFRELVAALYGYAFAGRPCGPEEFARWRARAVPEQYAASH